MSSGENLLFPRASIPADIGLIVRKSRLKRGWSQERLARKLKVNRRTVSRLEHGQHRPTSHLVHLLQNVLDTVHLVPAWRDPVSPHAPCYGPRARLARLAAGLTILEAARAANVSSATLSRFENELSNTSMIIGPSQTNRAINNGPYAVAIGFMSADDMEEYCRANDGRPWLDRIRIQRGK